MRLSPCRVVSIETAFNKSIVCLGWVGHREELHVWVALMIWIPVDKVTKVDEHICVAD